MEASEETKASSPAKSSGKRWSRKWWLSVAGAASLGLSGMVVAAAHSAAEKAGEKGIERWFTAFKAQSPSDDLPHRKIVGDWCVVREEGGGVRMLTDCSPDPNACTKLARDLGRFIIGKFQCLVVPPTTPMWCTVKAWSDIPINPPTTWCYFDTADCKKHDELCFPTTKAALAR
jgi:hypothetical protein